MGCKYNYPIEKCIRVCSSTTGCGLGEVLRNRRRKALKEFHKSYVSETRYFSSLIQDRKIKDYWDFDI